jgi:hypothetical protein
MHKQWKTTWPRCEWGAKSTFRRQGTALTYFHQGCVRTSLRSTAAVERVSQPERNQHGLQTIAAVREHSGNCVPTFRDNLSVPSSRVKMSTSSHRGHLYVLGRSQNKPRLLPNVTSTDWFLGAFAKLRKAIISFVMSVCPSAWNNSAPTGWIFMKFDIWAFFENLSRKDEFH